MKERSWIFFVVFGLLLLFMLVNHGWTGAFVMACVLMLGVFIKMFPTAEVDDDDDITVQQNASSECLCYEGSSLHFSYDELSAVLNKRSPYFTRLNFASKQKFIQRVQKFIRQKTFKIHDNSGFKEMPILVSAAAIQLSFGLEEYLLPNFDCIHIYPEEFIGVHPAIRVLEGNVSGSSINLSWKHFLKGFKFPDDGENVGLHEMAHAYYFQNFETSENVDKKFVAGYPQFDSFGNTVFETEKVPGNDFYSDYALTNFQEFWAASIELFFERPTAMKLKYPELYKIICDLLNQNPLGNTALA